MELNLYDIIHKNNHFIVQINAIQLLGYIIYCMINNSNNDKNTKNDIVTVNILQAWVNILYQYSNENAV